MGQGEWDSRARAPVGQLSPQVWMSWPETRSVIAALSAQGAEVRYVGGCVRDGLLNRLVHDIDMATPDPPEVVMALLSEAGIQVIPTGLKHGTVMARIGDRGFEITTLREDMKTDGRHAQVRWSSDWMADAARRDFTINALSATPDGAVYDYFNGLEHLAQKRVVFVGRAMDRIAEDRLRILRFFRFYGRYGCPPIDSDAFEACRTQARHLVDLSGERVRDEILNILTSPSATEVMGLMRGARVLETILPEAGNFGCLRQVVFLEERGLRLPGLENDPLRRLAAVLDGGRDAALRVAARLKLSNRDRDRLSGMLERGASLAMSLPMAECGRRIRRWGRAAFRDALILSWARGRARGDWQESQATDRFVARLQMALTWDIPLFPIKGADIVALGVHSGPCVGDLLAALEVWWEDQDYHPDREELLNEARRRLGFGMERL